MKRNSCGWSWAFFRQGLIVKVTLFVLTEGGWYLLAAMLNWLVVPGYASIIVAVLVLGGLQLLSLGVIGEYIGRLHLNVNRKPQYVVRQLTAICKSGD